MSETAPAIRSDSVAKFKQRHEAYGITASLSEAVTDAKAMMQLGMAKETARNLGSLLVQIDRNPEAQQMLAARAPAELQEARALVREAIAAAPHQVRTTSIGEWNTQDGVTETRLSLGRSDKGFHYAVEVSHRGGEPQGGWSPPFQKETAARKAGQAAESRALDINFSKHPRIERTHRGEHAAKLHDAAALRRSAASDKSHDMPARAAASVQQAMAAVTEARESRQAHESGQQRHVAWRAIERDR